MWAHRIHMPVQSLLCCLQYDHQAFISAYCQKDGRGRDGITTPLTESSTLNYHGVFLSTENSIASDKRWITPCFHQQFMQFVDLILPQAIIGFHYRTCQPCSPPQPHCQKYFWRNAVQRNKLKRLSADPLISPTVSGILKLKGQWPSFLIFLSQALRYINQLIWCFWRLSVSSNTQRLFSFQLDMRS